MDRAVFDAVVGVGGGIGAVGFFLHYLPATRACEQAKEFGHSAARECGYLTTHSMLHLPGYDHERNDEDTRLMRSKEEEYMNAIGLTRDV